MRNHVTDNSRQPIIGYGGYLYAQNQIRLITLGGTKLPRRNSNAREVKKTPYHVATQFHGNYRSECVGCFFVGHNFSCTTSDGVCLITHKDNKGINSTNPVSEEAKNSEGLRNKRTG